MSLFMLLLFGFLLITLLSYSKEETVELEDAVKTVTAAGMDICSRNGLRLCQDAKGKNFTVMKFDTEKSDLIEEKDFDSLESATEDFLKKAQS